MARLSRKRIRFLPEPADGILLLYLLRQGCGVEAGDDRGEVRVSTAWPGTGADCGVACAAQGVVRGTAWLLGVHHSQSRWQQMGHELRNRTVIPADSVHQRRW